MKTKACLLFGFMLAATLTVNAQQGRGGQQPMSRTPEDRVKAFSERVIPELKVNDDQKKQLETIYLDFYKTQEKMFAEMRNGGERPDRTVMEKMNNERDEKVKKVLSEEQFKKLKEIEASQRQRMGGGQGQRPGNGQRPGRQGGPQK